MGDRSAETGVTDNLALSRYELAEAGHVAFADYRRGPGELVITYVEAPVPLRGSGAAGRLMQGVLAHARAEGVKVTPLCGYAALYIKRHPQL